MAVIKLKGDFGSKRNFVFKKHYFSAQVKGLGAFYQSSLLLFVKAIPSFSSNFQLNT